MKTRKELLTEIHDEFYAAVRAAATQRDAAKECLAAIRRRKEWTDRETKPFVSRVYNRHKALKAAAEELLELRLALLDSGVHSLTEFGLDTSAESVSMMVDNTVTN